MIIDIVGYVTERFTNYHFTIKVTGDRVKRLSLSNLQVSKEVRIYISPYLYPSDNDRKFETLPEEDNFHRDQRNECLFLGKTLRMGDHIKCSVCIVEGETRNGREIYPINRTRKYIESYADFPLWLYPNDGSFRRLESDSRESLKFRKQWRYTCMNRKEYKKITGYTLFGYRDKKWVNKNPKITFPILWWIRVKTTVSNLLKRLKNATIIGLVLGIIGLVATIIFGIISIIF